jgi:hypothetical protein
MKYRQLKASKWRLYRGFFFQVRHVMSVHSVSPQMSVPCDVCDKTFANASKLKRHKNEVHLKRRFSCRFCPKTYSRGDELNRHQRKCSSLVENVESSDAKKMKILVQNTTWCQCDNFLIVLWCIGGKSKIFLPCQVFLADLNVCET